MTCGSLRPQPGSHMTPVEVPGPCPLGCHSPCWLLGNYLCKMWSWPSSREAWVCVCVCLRVNFIVLAVREEAARQAVCGAVGLGGEAGVPSSLPMLPLPLLCCPPSSTQLLPLHHFPALPTVICLLQSLRRTGWGPEHLVKSTLCGPGNRGAFLCRSVFISVEMNGDHYLIALL